jgi:purine nucleoside permease
LDRIVDIPGAYRPLRMNDRGLLCLVCGVGAARAAASVMALGLDSRFDLSHAYFVIAGIAGVDPARGSLGSVVLPQFVVDGDLTHQLDAREIPGDWPDGFVAIGKSLPYEEPRAHRFNGADGIVHRLDSQLVAWAYGATRSIGLLDTPAMAERRTQFLPAETAQRAPSILLGDELASTTFWHGRAMSERAARWVKYQTDGAAIYSITAMEDAGILTALQALSESGRMDWKRVLVVRGVSNFDRQREGISAAESLAETRVAAYSAYLPALENVHRVGGTIVRLLLANDPLFAGTR